jgi:hypothetical protein
MSAQAAVAECQESYATPSYAVRSSQNKREEHGLSIGMPERVIAMADLPARYSGIMAKYQLFLLQAVEGSRLASPASEAGFGSTIARAWSMAHATTGGFYRLRCSDDVRARNYDARAESAAKSPVLAERVAP